jgi:hypothetical protein
MWLPHANANGICASPSAHMTPVCTGRYKHHACAANKTEWHEGQWQKFRVHPRASIRTCKIEHKTNGHEIQRIARMEIEAYMCVMILKKLRRRESF